MLKRIHGLKMAQALLAASLVVFSSQARAADLNLSNVPLFIGGSVEPNVMFTLDDSGSMHWENMPDDNWTYFLYPRQEDVYGSDDYGNFAPRFDDTASYNVRIRSPHANKIYYNPTVRYIPWSKYDGTSFGNASPTCAPHNPFNRDIDGDGNDDEVGDDCRNLTVDNSESASWERYDGGAAGFPGGVTTTTTTLTFYPAVYYRYNGGDDWDESNYTKVEIKTGSTYAGGTNRSDCSDSSKCTYTEEIQNFANWYTYYRSRILAARAGIGRAFAQQGTGMRVGFGSINKGSLTVDGYSTGGVIIEGLRGFESTDRENWFDTLYGHAIPTSSTPLRNAVKRVGDYFKWSDSRGPWGETPGTATATAHLTCRQSYHVLMTDGYYNGSDPGFGNIDNTDGSNIISDIDGSTYKYTAATPYKDSYSDTLADAAHYYWKTDLRSDVDNKVPPNTADPAFWQHMVTYTVGLGVSGSLDETATAAAILAGTDPGWPNPTGGNPQKIDDLWHAAVNSRGEFFSAADPETFATSLSNILISLVSRTTSAASVALTSGSLQSGSFLYQARFDTGTWTGQLLAFPVNTDGTLGVQAWDAGTKIPAHGSRKIATFNGTVGKPFQWTDLAAGQQTEVGSELMLNYIRGDDTNEADNGGSYRNRSVLLGDIINSAPAYVGAPFSPYPDDWGVAGNSEVEDSYLYSTFRKTHLNRNPLVYVGANDGMLHMFDATTGDELGAYLPSMLMSKLSDLSAPLYNHEYFADGSPTVIDAFYSNAWHTVLVAGLNGGGQGLYALDITSPPTSTTTETQLAAKVLWEFDDSDNAELGYTYSQPNIVRVHFNDGSGNDVGKWVAIFGNGYNSTEADGTASSTGDAHLIIVDIEDGSEVVVGGISTGYGTAEDPLGVGRPNGLSTVTPIDADGDQTMDYVYAGDLFGNVWKFDISSGDTSTWDVAYKTAASGGSPKPLFKAMADPSVSTSIQPITTRLRVARHPAGEDGFLVFFGTGKYLEVGDSAKSGQTTQSFYAIWDRHDTSSVTFLDFDRDDLLQQEIDKEVTVSGTDYRVTSDEAIHWHTQEYIDANYTGTPVPVASSTTPSHNDITSAGITTHLGWYMDLYNTESGNTDNEGERQVTNAILRGDRIIFTTLVPSDSACDFGGTGWLMELAMHDGGHLPASPFDVDGDGYFTSADYVDIDGDGTPDVVVGGKKSKVGIIPTPGILSDYGNAREFKYESGSSGGIEVVTENIGDIGGRQSWLELLD